MDARALENGEIVKPCPRCNFPGKDPRAVARGRAGTGACKARDPEKMRAAGRKGALARWAKRLISMNKI